MKQAYDLGINFFDTAERWVPVPAAKAAGATLTMSQLRRGPVRGGNGSGDQEVWMESQ